MLAPLLLTNFSGVSPVTLADCKVAKPVLLNVVAATVDGVTAPIGPGALQSVPSKKSAFKSVTFMVLNADVTFIMLALMVVNVPAAGVTVPIPNGDCLRAG